MLQDKSSSLNIEEIMSLIGLAAKSAQTVMAGASSQQKNDALNAMAVEIRKNANTILAANTQDIKKAKNTGLSPAFIDRLMLNNERIEAMAKGLETIALLDDPIGKVIAAWTRPNGLEIKRVRTPLGIIGVIYESRPNVTADAGALCIKAGNAVILRGGSDSQMSSQAIHKCLSAGLILANLPATAIQIVPTTDRAAVGEMLKGLNGAIDVIVPRGGKNLVKRVQDEARVPVFAHLEGLCHIYVDKSADKQMALEIVVNSKMRRTGICGSAETLLIDQDADKNMVREILSALINAGCEIRADKNIYSEHPQLSKATDKDWETEYLDAIISVKYVNNISGAINHIAQHSSNHTEAVVAENSLVVQRFFNEIDSAILLHNASTQFADGSEFGMGAEIGIATGKMHARGPVGVEQLTSFKYQVTGNGQIRPT